MQGITSKVIVIVIVCSIMLIVLFAMYKRDGTTSNDYQSISTKKVLLVDNIETRIPYRIGWTMPELPLSFSSYSIMPYEVYKANNEKWVWQQFLREYAAGVNPFAEEHPIVFRDFEPHFQLKGE